MEDIGTRLSNHSRQVPQSVIDLLSHDQPAGACFVLAMAMSGAERSKLSRSIARAGAGVERIPILDRAGVLNAMVECERLTEAETNDPQRIAVALGEIIHDWKKLATRVGRDPLPRSRTPGNRRIHDAYEVSKRAGNITTGDRRDGFEVKPPAGWRDVVELSQGDEG